MDFSWSEEQLARRQATVDFASDALSNERVFANDRDSTFPQEDWDRCAEYGLLRLSVPEQWGGMGVDLMTAVLMMEGFGYGCSDNGLAFAINTQLWTVQLPILEFGSDDQKRRFLPEMTAGRLIGAHALSEPESGSDAFNLKMTADKVAGGYVLNGIKHLVTLGPIADVALVFASTKPEAGRWGITAFLVPSDAEGFSASPSQDKMGLRTIPFGALHFDDCFVPDEYRLGKEGSGVSISTHSLEMERCCILASQLGAMQRQLESSVDRAKTREQFGRPIGEFQSISNRVADMRLRIETAQLLLYKVVWLKERRRPAMLEAALLKLHLSESFVASGLDAIRIHGGEGYVSEHGVERDLRDAIGGVLYAGTSDIQRNIIAALLGL
jgi:L-prolyl-PCP dehydrogenase